MDSPASTAPVRIYRWLPYWAVLQSDLRLTLNSWVYRVWVAVCILSAAGFLLYRVGIYRETGVVQGASHLISDLLKGSILGSLTLVVVLTAGCISSERGTIADSVLSRGISRYQYFLGKWHARMIAVLGTFFILAFAGVAAGLFWLHEDITLLGSLVAMISVASLLMAVVSLGVAVSASVNNTLVSVAVLWILLYGLGLMASFLPASMTTPYHVLGNLPSVMRGEFNLELVGKLLLWSCGLSSIACIVSVCYFSRRDV